MKPCPNCPSPRPPVPSDGPLPSRLLFLGEAPSYEEDRQFIPFCGRTGLELSGTYFPLLNLPRSSVHIANAHWCSKKGYVNPTPQEAQRCSSFHLGELLQQVKPEIIIPMGVVACSVLDESINLTLDHGIPRPGKYGAWSGIVFPTFHPTAGMHPGTSGYMIPLMADFDELRKLLLRIDRGEFKYPRNEFPNPDYRVIKTEADLSAYLPNGEIEFLGADTESKPDGSPYCLTFSHTPGTGRLIYARDKHLIREFTGVLTCYGLAREDEYIHQVFHNYLHDEDVYRDLEVPIGPFSDTMVRAYNLCLGGGGDDEGESRAGRGSLGLKVLAYRHCSMRMTSYKETVYPYSVPPLLDYLWKAESLFSPDRIEKGRCDCTHPNTLHAPRGKSGKVFGKCSLCDCPRFHQQKRLPTAGSKIIDLCHRKITNLIEGILSQEPGLDPWDRIKQWHDYDREAILDMLGPWPVPSIEFVPEPVLLPYAVGDADATLRLHRKLQNLSPWIFFD